MDKLLTRYIPQGYKQYSPEIGNYPKDLFSVYVHPEKTIAMFFVGKQSKPLWHYRFNTVERMKQQINGRISALMSWEDTKEKRKQERKDALKSLDKSQVKVGDIYHWSGGYNCTRNDYIQVTGFKGAKVLCVELNKRQHSGDWMNGEVIPMTDSEKGSVTAVIRPGYGEDKVMLRVTSHSTYKQNYYKWNGKPNWENCD